MPASGTILRRDFRIFRERGFLLAFGLLLLLSAITAAVLFYVNNRFGVPVLGRWW